MITEMKKLWGRFDKNIKIIWMIILSLLLLNISRIFFEDGGMAEYIIHMIMVTLICVEGWFVWKELEFLKVKEKFREL